jgi:hypothetical protein
MHKNATKCNETIGKWCKNKHGASKIIDTFETYHTPLMIIPHMTYFIVVSIRGRTHQRRGRRRTEAVAQASSNS